MNELDWKGYESITKYIYETLGKEFGIEIVGHGPDFKVTGASGVKHQIDVLTSSNDGNNKSQTAIECKCWKKKITKDTVMKLSKIIEDAGISKGIIVSKSGYTKDAMNFANHCNIELVILRERENNIQETEPKDLIFGILNIRLHITRHHPEILSIEVEAAEENLSKREKTFDSYNNTVLLSSGNKVPIEYYATQFQEALHNANRLFQIITHRFEIIGGSLVNNTDKSSIKIKGLIFTGVLKKSESNSNKEFSLTDQVWLIMKSIFEERNFTILKSGIIVEKKD